MSHEVIDALLLGGIATCFWLIKLLISRHLAKQDDMVARVREIERWKSGLLGIPLRSTKDHDHDDSGNDHDNDEANDLGLGDGHTDDPDDSPGIHRRIRRK